MSWTERQQTLLRAMGLRLWRRPDAAALPETAPGAAMAPALKSGLAPGSASPSVATDAARLGMPAAPPARPRPPVPGRAVAESAAPGPTAAVTAPLAAPLVQRDVAGLAWPALRQAVASCTACGLCQSRKQTVFGSGAESAHWLVVGEAPGEQEDLKGMPFVGPSGELLDAMLAALHLVRADRNPTAAGGDRPAPPQRQVFVANTVKCRPPKNRNPTAEELATCEPFLLRQIELLQPRIILALGAFAIKALLRTDEPVGKLRGRVHRYQGVPVVVSYHPAYLLRQPLEKARAWEDLCLAADTAQAPDA